MKVRWLLLVPVLMAVFAVAPLRASAAPSVVTDLKTGLIGDALYPFAHGVAEYKVRAGGGSSLAVSIQGAQALRFQKLYVNIEYPVDSHNYVNVCSLHIGVNGNGSCYIDTRSGAILPTISSGTYIYLQTDPNPAAPYDVAYGLFQ